jgi:hypothetical protein
MKETININDAKLKMKELNIIVYGTIRDIESHFFTSFLNIDIICSYFKEVYIIIFENDSTDKTREMLITWSKISIMNVKKHIILKNDLEKIYPLRAHRLAYCRNYILNYIFDNNLHHTYDYAIHCDLDERFWGVDFQSIANCFQYDLESWDVMTCVNKNRKYYDFWALRCDTSWFNINIFSCAANNIDYNTKVESFENLLKNTNGLISTTSSFNGLGIYKLQSIIYCRYNADYKCNICNNKNRGCWEDNDHIGLHKQMINYNYKIFINNKMFIQTKPEKCKSYNMFIKDIYNINNIGKNVLSYILMNNLANKSGKWLIINTKDCEIANKITNYYTNTLYAINDNTSEINTTYLNKNITTINTENYTNIYEKINIVYKNSSEYISFIYIDCSSYQTTKMILNNVYNKIQNGCIIIFDKLVNYKNFMMEALKAFYEFTSEYEIVFEWLMLNGVISENNMDSHDNKQVAIKITKNKYFNYLFTDINYLSEEYDSFDWIYYTNKNSDLMHIKTKEEAYLHWLNYGKYEGRILEPINMQEQSLEEEDIIVEDFDWKIYIEINSDLKQVGINNKKDALIHWKNHGIKEGRKYKIDWCQYIKQYNLISLKIDNKMDAIKHWLDNDKPEIHANINYDNELFDWVFYIKTYPDLLHIKNKNEALNHWIHFGKSEGRIPHNFNWINYLLANPDLVKSGINIENAALEHWLKIGKRENRKISL